jgi:uncharacterized membrane protein YkoI
MFSRVPVFLAAMAPLLLAGPADSRPRDREQESAWRGMQEGRFLPLRTIEGMIVPKMRGAEYLGPELDAGAGRYRLKFMRGGQVIWVDVDARTGAVLGRSR